jgi:hypothetical protein
MALPLLLYEPRSTYKEKMSMKKLFAFAVAVVLAGGIAFAQTPAAEPKKEATPTKEEAKKSAKHHKDADAKAKKEAEAAKKPEDKTKKPEDKK